MLPQSSGICIVGGPGNIPSVTQGSPQRPFPLQMSTLRPRVLVLEDNPALAESIEFALVTFGLDVIVAVLDLELGTTTSIPTAMALRAAGIPFLFMSGHDMDEEVPEEFQNEMTLPKPIEPEILVDAIRELLRSCAPPKSA